MIIFFFIAIAGSIFIDPLSNFQISCFFRDSSYSFLQFLEILFVPFGSLPDTGIEMRISESVDKCLGNHPSFLGNYLGESSITGYIKRNTQKLITASLVELQFQLAFFICCCLVKNM